MLSCAGYKATIILEELKEAYGASTQSRRCPSVNLVI